VVIVIIENESRNGIEINHIMKHY